ncbi:MAG: AmmeMemoRadiSam system protein A [Geobacteraceae bacterium]|nr:AmmeMemoRadiSam system protein A [Geobacteraceae bacterium]
MENLISPEEQQLLLQIAREAIHEAVGAGSPCEKQEGKGNLLEKRGCFVTITTRGRLRGCIGLFSSDKPLCSTVREMAIAAATKDPRFYPLTKDELGEIELEISVLSPLKKIQSIEEIQVGVHGIYIEKNMFRGVLLPQVASEHGWDRTTFLEQTCLKAGLEPDAWKNEADIYIFSAQIFGDR